MNISIPVEFFQRLAMHKARTQKLVLEAISAFLNGDEGYEKRLPRDILAIYLTFKDIVAPAYNRAVRARERREAKKAEAAASGQPVTNSSKKPSDIIIVGGKEIDLNNIKVEDIPTTQTEYLLLVDTMAERNGTCRHDEIEQLNKIILRSRYISASTSRP